LKAQKGKPGLSQVGKPRVERRQREARPDFERSKETRAFGQEAERGTESLGKNVWDLRGRNQPFRKTKEGSKRVPVELVERGVVSGKN